jgi:hypothetical protein
MHSGNVLENIFRTRVQELDFVLFVDCWGSKPAAAALIGHNRNLKAKKSTKSPTAKKTKTGSPSESPSDTPSMSPSSSPSDSMSPSSKPSGSPSMPYTLDMFYEHLRKNNGLGSGSTPYMSDDIKRIELGKYHRLMNRCKASFPRLF